MSSGIVARQVAESSKVYTVNINIIGLWMLSSNPKKKKKYSKGSVHGSNIELVYYSSGYDYIVLVYLTSISLNLAARTNV